jgi:hypothetical protein
MILYHGSFTEVSMPDYWRGRERLDFVTLCRMGAGRDKNLDLIIGSVANDKVFEELEAYFNGYSDKATAIKKLRYEEPNLQYCFANQEAIDTYLHFLNGEVIA